MDILASDLDIEGILPQAAALAFPADSPSGKSAQEIFVLNLVFIGLNPPEEFIEPDEGFLLGVSLASFPDH